MTTKIPSSLLEQPSLGISQTWQSVTGSRALDTLYTNTTDRSIVVSLTCTITDDGVDLEVGGVVIMTADATTSTFKIPLTAIVPPGSTYRAIQARNSAVLLSWNELR